MGSHPQTQKGLFQWQHLFVSWQPCLLDFCKKLQGQRVAQQISEIVASGANLGRSFVSYSIIGHSLGGIVARIAATILDSSQSLQPRLFVSLFTPHAGLENFINSKLLPFVIHMSGTDRGAMDELCEKAPEESVLVEISQGQHREALLKFQKRVLYSSATDWLVDFGSGAITTETLPVEDEHEHLAASPAYPLLGLRSWNFSSGADMCNVRSVRCNVIQLLHDLPFERVSAQWDQTSTHSHP